MLVIFDVPYRLEGLGQGVCNRAVTESKGWGERAKGRDGSDEWRVPKRKRGGRKL